MSEKRMLSIEEKKQLNRDRQHAVRAAWSKEKERVLQGEGTRDWTPEQQKEIVQNGRIEGYEGHHMKSVSNYPEQAGSPDNIQFLTEKEHFGGAHQRNFHIQTNGYYNPNTAQMENFSGDELHPVELQELSVPSFENGKETGEVESFENSQTTEDVKFNESAKAFVEPVNTETAVAFNESVKGAASENVSSKAESQSAKQSQSSGIHR